MSNIITNVKEHENCNSLMNEFNKYYPNIDPNFIDDELFENMLENIVIENNNKINESYQTDIKHKQQNMINNNILMADELIPEMSIPTNLIYLKGRLNGVPINIMIDTGASCCFTYNSIIIKCGLEDLIDKSSKTMVRGAHSFQSTLGNIWFLEVELDISNGQEQYVSVPITVNISDDTEIIKDETEINNEFVNKIKKINEIVGKNNNLFDINFVEKEIEKMKNNNDKSKLDLILGINFLKSYRANIDFSTMTMTLNKSIQIKFK